jgi:hypothetical protein
MGSVMGSVMGSPVGVELERVIVSPAGVELGSPVGVIELGKLVEPEIPSLSYLAASCPHMTDMGNLEMVMTTKWDFYIQGSFAVHSSAIH